MQMHSQAINTIMCWYYCELCTALYASSGELLAGKPLIQVSTVRLFLQISRVGTNVRWNSWWFCELNLLYKRATCSPMLRCWAACKESFFFKWRCVRNECEACGVAKLGINKCNIWNKCELEADVLEWVHTDWQGSKNGKQKNTIWEFKGRLWLTSIYCIISINKIPSRNEIIPLIQSEEYGWCVFYYRLLLIIVGFYGNNTGTFH